MLQLVGTYERGDLCHYLAPSRDLGFESHLLLFRSMARSDFLQCNAGLLSAYSQRKKCSLAVDEPDIKDVKTKKRL